MTGNGAAVRTAVIAAVNDKGVKPADEDAWHNFSKWARPDDLDDVHPGDRVEVSIDGSGFVRRLRRVETASHTSQMPAPVPLPCKDVQIIRESCIKSAAQFCAARPELKSSDLFALAEKMEQWITRGV